MVYFALEFVVAHKSYDLPTNSVDTFFHLPSWLRGYEGGNNDE